MRSWWKHNKKLMNAGELKPERVEMFKQLLELGEKYKHVNQYQQFYGLFSFNQQKDYRCSHWYEDFTLPYLSGPDLCRLSTTFGLARTYIWGSNRVGANKSRWEYMQDLMKYLNPQDRIPELT